MIGSLERLLGPTVAGKSEKQKITSFRGSPEILQHSFKI
ncbi:MAG: hypothetical protein RBG13Loki_1596 [Promethearchaeota archaeon CR_4]|nr:MAG: hypothetical protein RBG13Loki_1596 [Candidatus Lokiarchaeota archaeon CR_4]